jgi:sugar phosphate isomerase/epimerase
VLPAIAQVGSLPASFRDDVLDYAAGQCRALEIWFTKLESYLTNHSLDEVQNLLNEQGMAVPAGSFQGGLLATQGEARREAWELFRRRLELCRELQIGIVVIAGDIQAKHSEELVERVHDSLRQAADEAAGAGVRVALEFQATASYINNLQTAASVVAELNHPHLGLCLDVFHFYTGPSKFEDLGYLTRENLFHVQLSDLAGVPREFATDADRILPGDGDIPIAPLLEHLRVLGYSRYVSVELMNPQLWSVPPLQFGEIAMTALRKLLGVAQH